MLFALIFLLLCGIWLYAWFLEPATLEKWEQTVEVDPAKLKKPVRILFISDLHVGPSSSRLSFYSKFRLIRAAHARQPFQLILFGGDYLDHDQAYLPRLKRAIGEFASLKLPMYGVMGNHDHAAYGWKPSRQFRKELASVGLTLLCNQSEVVRVGGEKLLLIGLEEIEASGTYGDLTRRHFLPWPEYSQNARKLDWYRQFDEVRAELPRILLTHNPDGVYLPGKRPPEVALAGHTHGGQVVWLRWLGHYLPSLMPLGSFTTWSGRRLVNKTTLLVIRGWGGSRYPVRLFCRPQVLALTLRPAELPEDLVIGLAGKPRSGKDTVAGMLNSLFPGLSRIAIGDAVKKEYDRLHGTDTLHNLEQKLVHRDGLNALGKERREVDRDYWTKKTITAAGRLLITDVRWPHEADVVHQAKGFLIRVEADKAVLRQRVEAEFHSHIDNHFESQMDGYGKWDFVVKNNGTYEELEVQIQKVAAEIRRRWR